MRPHGILDAGVRFLSVMHGDIAIAVAGHSTGGHGRHGRGRGRIGAVKNNGLTSRVKRGQDRSAAMMVRMIVPVARGEGRLRLACVIPGHLSSTVVSSRATSRVGIRLLLPRGMIHGEGCSSKGGAVEDEGDEACDEDCDGKGCADGCRKQLSAAPMVTDDKDDGLRSVAASWQSSRAP